jgi:hypothetical protein
MNLVKHLLKKFLWRWVFYHKIYGTATAKNKNFLSYLDESALFSREKLNVFTTGDEDGILLNIFTKISTTDKIFVDIGSNDCINSNCANLAFHHNWNGLFIDGNKTILERGKHIYSKYFGKLSKRFSFTQAIVTVNNINEILNSFLLQKEIDLLSIDLDGNDYFIWDKITALNPRVVVTEVQVEKGSLDFIPEYSNEFEFYESNLPKGASPLSMIKLAESKGYKLVAANNGCYNLFFVRKDCLKNLEELTLEDALKNS